MRRDTMADFTFSNARFIHRVTRRHPTLDRPPKFTRRTLDRLAVIPHVAGNRLELAVGVEFGLDPQALPVEPFALEFGHVDGIHKAGFDRPANQKRRARLVVKVNIPVVHQGLKIDALLNHQFLLSVFRLMRRDTLQAPFFVACVPNLLAFH